jgi:DNA-binding protein
MRRFTIAIAAGFLPSAFMLLPIAEASYGCKVTAVVKASQDLRLRPGARLCRNQNFRKPISPVLITCTKDKKDFWLVYPEELRNCESKVSSKSSDQFFRARGVTEQDKPSLIKPYGRFLANTQPTIEWAKVPGAKSYSILIWGKQRQVFQAESNRLSPSLGMPILASGKTYTIIIKAIANGKAISRSISALNILSESQIKEIKKEVLEVDNSFATPNEKTYLRLSILSKYHLVDDSIALMEEQLEFNSNDAKFHRVLAETYFNVGLLYQAKYTYERAEIIANNTNDKTEYVLAKEGLRAVVALMNSQSLKP